MARERLHASPVETVFDEETRLAREQTITVEIEGAWLVNAGDGKVELNLSGMKLAEVDWQDVEAPLRAAGVEEGDVAFLCNEFANRVMEHLLAKALAKRVKRVG